MACVNTRTDEFESIILTSFRQAKATNDKNATLKSVTFTDERIAMLLDFEKTT